MPCGVVWHSSARACWRCPKRTQLAVYALIALNASTRARKVKSGQNPTQIEGAVGLELSICDGFKGAENGKGSFCIANVRHLTAKRGHIFCEIKIAAT